MKTLIALCLAATCGAGFAAEPPACSAASVTNVVRELFWEQKLGLENSPTPKDAAAWKVFSTISVSDVVVNGYDKDIGRRACEGGLSFGADAKRKWRVSYTAHFTESNPSSLMVRANFAGISNAEALVLREVIVQNINAAAVKTAAPAPAATPPVTAAPAVKPAARASFDCAKAASPVEKLICASPELRRFDGAMGENYQYMLAADIGAGAREDLRKTQRAWVATRNKCTDAQCLTKAYTERLDAVCEYPVISGVHPICTSADDVLKARP